MSEDMELEARYNSLKTKVGRPAAAAASWHMGEGAGVLNSEGSCWATLTRPVLPGACPPLQLKQVGDEASWDLSSRYKQRYNMLNKWIIALLAVSVCLAVKDVVAAALARRAAEAEAEGQEAAAEQQMQRQAS
jgi:hypothetical protein